MNIAYSIYFFTTSVKNTGHTTLSDFIDVGTKSEIPRKRSIEIVEDKN